MEIAVLHATFYASSYAQPAAPQADLIVPISNMRKDAGNHVSVPPAFSVTFSSSITPLILNLLLQLNVTLPRNTIKVFAELYASGNGDEEFWVGGFLLSCLFPFLNPHSTVLQHGEPIPA